MGEYNSLEFFNLKNHGDGREQVWGQLIHTEFPAYEDFWRRYVVPLTNRINPAILDTTSEWIRLRPEVKTLEWMPMCHYSVFHYLARARVRMLDDTSPLFPEDGFALLDTCGDNVLLFFESVRKIFSDFGYAPPQLPIQEPMLCIREDRIKPKAERGGFVRAKEYRNVMMHNPVLGRTIDKTADMLPHWTVLESVQLSWRAAESLKPGDWISCHDFFAGLYLDITRFLQDEWQSILGAMEDLRYKPQHAAKFKDRWALAGLTPIITPRITLAPTVVSQAVSSVLMSNVALYSPTVVGTVMLKKHEK